MNVVFLDIDGVLNSEEFALKREREHQRKHAGKKCDCADRGAHYILHSGNIDSACVARLNELLLRTNAAVVISSTWRKLLDLAEIDRILTEHGFMGTIISWTPHDREPDYNVKRRGHRIERGDEIVEWIYRWSRSNPDNVVRRFVILDDGSDMAAFPHRLVQTDPIVGFTDIDLDRAIRVMESQ